MTRVIRHGRAALRLYLQYPVGYQEVSGCTVRMSPPAGYRINAGSTWVISIRPLEARLLDRGLFQSIEVCARYVARSVPAGERVVTQRYM